MSFTRSMMRVDGAYYVVALLLLLSFTVFYGVQNSALASTVTVSATVASSVTCSTDNTSISFGTLTSAAIATAALNASTTMSCNTGLGCTLSVSDSNHGLATSSPAYTIPSGNMTLVAGTEGYGIQAATTTVGSGSALGINALYLVTGNVVGSLNTTSTVLASSTGSISSREVVVKHKAAISGTTQAASYADTITYSCVSN